MKNLAYTCDYCGEEVITKSEKDVEGWGCYSHYMGSESHICPSCRKDEVFKFWDLTFEKISDD